MARPLTPLRRLLRLRDRVEQGEKSALRQVEFALRAEEDAFHSFDAVFPGNAQTAAEWQSWQQGRDFSWQRAQVLERHVEEQMLSWQRAKREHRQAELLLERRAQERQSEQESREIREQEDWIRARDARREEEG